MHTTTLAAAALLALPAAQEKPSPRPVDRLEPAVLVRAGGADIDLGKEIGHSTPTLVDLDRDGKLDLVTGSFGGYVTLHRNVGSATAPEFAKGERLKAGGEDIRIHNW
ncbi:MAG: hypothetical protein R3F34_11480 [Planctomycetota bacterium]